MGNEFRKNVENRKNPIRGAAKVESEETKKDMNAETTKKKELVLFSNGKLKALLLPLLLEQLLNVLVGMVDTIMVSSVGEAAVSGVSLVDTLNLFFIMIFSGLATGGAILCAQLIGVRKESEARKTGNQLLLAICSVALFFTVFCLLTRKSLLSLVFGNVETAVMENALDYFTFIALSLPFLALHNGCGALFRSVGDSKTPMKISLVMNAANLIGNAFCLYVLNMGVIGVALPTLLSRILAAILNWILIRREGLPISMRRFSFRFQPKRIAKILQIGIPSGLENSIFQVGKILVLGLISTLGTSAITANAVANSVLTFQTLCEDAIGIGMITVVGQCVGASESEQARGYTWKLMKYTYVLMWIVNIVIFLGMDGILQIYHLSPETSAITRAIMGFNIACAFSIWPIAFTLPNALRASGHVIYTMGVSLFSMWAFRIVLSYVLVKGFGLGLFGIYFAFFVDWVFRCIAFLWKVARKDTFRGRF